MATDMIGGRVIYNELRGHVEQKKCGKNEATAHCQLVERRPRV
jgi:hypothetical protein